MGTNQTWPPQFDRSYGVTPHHLAALGGRSRSEPTQAAVKTQTTDIVVRLFQFELPAIHGQGQIF